METRVHISIEVKDLAKSIEFYSRLFATDPTRVKVDYANFRLETPQLHLALNHSPDKNPSAAHPTALHFGIELFSEERLSTWLDVAKSSGFNPRIEEDVACCYATGDKFWVADPDNNQWEFWVRTGDIEEKRGVSSSGAQKAPNCCAPGRC